MAKESSISVDLDDPRIGKIADVISNKTSKKILMLLADGEISEGDISSKLGLPINTIEYNLKKLMEAGLIEKAQKFFWSVKGKKIPLYKVSNKKIVISPKSSSGGIISALLISGLIALGIKIFSSSSQDAIQTASDSSGGSASVAAPAIETALRATNEAYNTGVFTYANSWLWFLLGSLIAVFVIILTKIIIERRLK